MNEKLVMTLAIFAVAGSVSGWRLVEANNVKREMSSLRAEINRCEQQVQSMTGEISSLEDAVLRKRMEHQRAVSDLTRATRVFERKFPDSRWAVQPEVLPQWNPESPFIWIRKDIMKRLPGPAFTSAGELEMRLLPILTVEPAELRQLNAGLRQCIETFRAAEVENVRKTDNHLPGLADREGDKITIEVLLSRETGAVAKAEFEEIVRHHLGRQRSDIVLSVSASWIDSEFAQSSDHPKTITLVRNRSGAYDIAVRSGGSWMSTGFPKEYRDNLKHYVPPHLIPFFSELLTD